MGETCNSIRGKLNKLDAKGVPAYVEAQSRGKKLAGQQKADADAYNGLLNQYLGARCHEPQRARLDTETGLPLAGVALRDRTQQGVI
jgi:hypothetical protein